MARAIPSDHGLCIRCKLNPRDTLFSLCDACVWELCIADFRRECRQDVSEFRYLGKGG